MDTIFGWVYIEENPRATIVTHYQHFTTWTKWQKFFGSSTKRIIRPLRKWFMNDGAPPFIA